MKYVDEQPIVVGVDGSLPALHAVRWAAGEAQRRGAPLRLVHACNVVPVRHPVRLAPPSEFRDAILTEGRHWLNTAADTARRAVPGVAPSTDLRDGGTAEILVAESASAQLVVLGSRGLGGFAGLLLGSVTLALAAHAHCPVVVMPTSTVSCAPADHGPVVVGVDGSALSEAAVEFAFMAAAMRGAPLHAVHTWLDLDMAATWAPRLAAAPDAIDWAALKAEETQLLDDTLIGWRDKFPDVELRRFVERDRPQHALLRRASGAQLLVVGSRGRAALTGLGLGSVSQTLLHHATCPVAVMRA